MSNKSNSFLTHFSIAKQTALLMVVITLGVLLIGAIATYSIENLRKADDALYQKAHHSMVLLDRFQDQAIVLLQKPHSKNYIQALNQTWELYVNDFHKNYGVKNSDLDKISEILTKISRFANDPHNSIEKLQPYIKHLRDFSQQMLDKERVVNNSQMRILKYALFALTLFVLLLSLAIAYFVMRQFKKLMESYAQTLEEREKESREIEAEVMQRVEQTIKEVREKDQIIYQNARLASMGEMIGNIAHQWRQPLNALTLLIQSFGTKSMTGNLTQEFIDKQVEEGMRLAVSMSDTIEDFRNFFSTEREKERFSLKESIEHALDISSFYLKEDQIAVQTDLDSDLKIYGYSNEFSRVILNLINNARENFKHQGKEKSKEITITLKKVNNKIKFEFIDNGGGIEEEILDRIFEPYFTTKHKAIGTGIGLYMSKHIVETQMGGTILAKNIVCDEQNQSRCAKFTIIFPLS